MPDNMDFDSTVDNRTPIHPQLLAKKQAILAELRNSTDILKALADPYRQDILMMFMLDKRLNVSQVVERSRLSRPAISHHLKILKQAGVLDSRKEATEVYYSLTREDSIVIRLRRLLDAVEALENDPDKTYERLSGPLPKESD
ncbi:metalloregulator ArsR/SmtB family transcription factor [Saccharibacillus sp. CPCC 101409]|uniref:ArsR/SmtB family transcription factor n=1 Tax=Saccharibacillus sp. CPCC 101409 TaxID=3058041 RepID=UPI002670E3E1|nr:metalloregulator ArsR/SmtB family transcription factor [Saccharibacillus sp. CPCC 101409]MDO3409461.1 metalloregulator ArsR/SmtB family transcription factor [Saccharibacillus sp. CPCC 101409]